jgi:hypothetical protein
MKTLQKYFWLVLTVSAIGAGFAQGSGNLSRADIEIANVKMIADVGEGINYQVTVRIKNHSQDTLSFYLNSPLDKSNSNWYRWNAPHFISVKIVPTSAVVDTYIPLDCCTEVFSKDAVKQVAPRRSIEFTLLLSDYQAEVLTDFKLKRYIVVEYDGQKGLEQVTLNDEAKKKLKQTYKGKLVSKKYSM